MKLTHIEHIGIAVNNLDEAVKYYEDVLGLKCYKTEDIEEQKVRTAFFKIGDVKIELLEPLGGEGPIARFLEKRGEGVHHLAFATPDLQGALDHFRAKGAKLIDEKPRDGAENLKIGFIHPSSNYGVLTELCTE